VWPTLASCATGDDRWAGHAAPNGDYDLHTLGRSILRYLGDIVRQYGDSAENPIKFYIRRTSADQKISVVYSGKAYSVGPYQDDSEHTIGTDNTLPILALLEQLLNLRKSAKEITSSPTAILVP
jgi:hypothetical protein